MGLRFNSGIREKRTNGGRQRRVGWVVVSTNCEMQKLWNVMFCLKQCDTIKK